MSAIEKETRKIELYGAGQLGQQDERGERAEHRADGVERAMDAERAPEVGALLDSEISESRGAVRMPLPRRSIMRTAVVPSHAPLTTTRRSLQIADAPVAGGGDLLVALLAVGHEAAEQAHQRRGALVHAVDEAELQRAEADLVGQVQRQDSRDHLLGEVCEEAYQAEEDDRSRDRDPPPTATCGRAAMASAGARATASAGTFRTDVYTLV